MVLVTIRIVMPSTKYGEALGVLRSLVEMNKVQPACVSCRIYQDAADKNILLLEERWTSEETLEHHLRSDEFLNVLLIMDMALKQPEIKFDIITSSTGIETIENARRALR